MLQRAATLGLGGTNNPALDVRDTLGTPSGAAAAAQAALDAGADLILGPLTSSETAAVAPLAQARGVAILAFTNDTAQSQPGVWPLGITLQQQIRRLLDAGRAEGRTRVATLLPTNELGRAAARAVQTAAASAGLSISQQVEYAADFNSVNQAVRTLSNYGARRGPLDAQIRALRARGDAAGRREAQQLARQSVPPPNFDLLFLAEGGNRLREIASLLPYYDIDQPAVQLLGPATWQAEAATLGQEAALVGAWFSAPDPESRIDFTNNYQATHGNEPPRIADIAFDAAAIARVVANRGGFTIASLTTAEGFSGASGLIILSADGDVRRGLGLFQVQRRGATLLQPAPETLAAPGF